MHFPIWIRISFLEGGTNSREDLFTLKIVIQVDLQKLGFLNAEVSFNLFCGQQDLKGWPFFVSSSL